MTPSDQPFFPYPSDPLRQVGFIVGDLIAVGVIVLILIDILKI
jgi:hypothetical protein